MQMKAFLGYWAIILTEVVQHKRLSEGVHEMQI